MRVTIGSSSKENIDELYKENASEIIEYLASQNCDLNWGCASLSIMGICYRVFSKYKRKLFGFTTQKYIDDVKNLKEATNVVCDSTLDLKKNLFYQADLIVMLPGGTGTISEFFAFLEEIRSVEREIPLILYNKDGHFNYTLALIDDLVNRRFNTNDIFNYFIVVDTLDDFKKIFEKYRKE